MDLNKIFLGLNYKWGKQKKHTDTLSQCLNCSTALEKNQFYCFVCGQKNKTSTVTIWSLLGDMFANIFNLDHSVWQSLIGVFKPAYLTQEFIKGKRKSFLNPLRLFFVAMIVHFTLLSSLINMDVFNEMAKSDLGYLAKKEIQAELTDLRDSTAYILSLIHI